MHAHDVISLSEHLTLKLTRTAAHAKHLMQRDDA